MGGIDNKTNNEYYVIHKKVLPDYFEKVIKIKDLLLEGKSVSTSCKEIGLSRSTFYKYKNYVNRPSIKVGKKVIKLKAKGWARLII